MARATWNGHVLAESDATVSVESNLYFPPASLHDEHLVPSDTTTVCGWKGTASYYHVEVDGARNDDAAWVYRDPKPEAEEIRDHVAFWRGVEVTP